MALVGVGSALGSVTWTTWPARTPPGNVISIVTNGPPPPPPVRFTTIQRSTTRSSTIPKTATRLDSIPGSQIVPGRACKKMFSGEASSRCSPPAPGCPPPASHGDGPAGTGAGSRCSVGSSPAASHNAMASAQLRKSETVKVGTPQERSCRPRTGVLEWDGVLGGRCCGRDEQTSRRADGQTGRRADEQTSRRVDG